MPTTRVCGPDLAPRGARPPRAPGPGPTGRASRPSAARPRRARHRSTSAGTGPAPPPRTISSSGSPKVFAQPAWRWSSSKRAGVDASRSEPTSCHDGSTPVSAARRRYSSTPYIIIRVSVTVPRSWPDEPGRVERRARGQLRAVDAGRCRSSRARRGGRRSRPADAAADDHRPRVLGHRRSHPPIPPDRQRKPTECAQPPARASRSMVSGRSHALRPRTSSRRSARTGSPSRSGGG